MKEHRLRVARSARFFTVGDPMVQEKWIVLHGYGELASEFIQHFSSHEDKAYFVAPEGLSKFYREGHSAVGASWMTREDRASEIDDYVRFLDRVREQTIAPDDRLTVLGFSQGGHTACRWIATGQGIRRLVLWGSTLPQDLDELKFQKAVRSCGVTLVAGSKDRFATTEKLNADLGRAEAMNVDARLVTYDGGHSIDLKVLDSLMARSQVS